MYMGSRSSRTAFCAFSVVPDGTGFWVEIQFPGLRPGLLSVVPRDWFLGWLRSGSQDCVLGYFQSSLTGLVSGLRSGSEDCVLGYFLSSLTGLVSVVPDGTGF